MNYTTTVPEIIEYNNSRILTTQQIAEAYGTQSKIISQNFLRNKEHYIDGKHYFKVEGEEKRSFCDHLQIEDGSKKASTMYLWTERGAFLHAKSLNTDKAWEAYEELVERYFKPVGTQMVESLQSPKSRPQNQVLISKNEVMDFEFCGTQIRAVLVEGNPWFILKDICGVLELTNPTMVSVRLDDDEVTKFNLGGLSGEVNIVNESGLYKVIFQSKKPEAKKFTKWVTSEVLPTIRKTGGYGLPTTLSEALYLAGDLAKKNEQLVIENQSMKPKSEYFDKLVERNLLTNLRDTSKEFGIKPKKFIESMIDTGYLYRDSKKRIKPYQKYVADGMFELKEFQNSRNGHADVQTLITPKGRETIRLLLPSIIGKDAE